jgi:2-phospho-L-lactate/phosphoenolpyruvate guanylyltransferase
MWQVLVPVKGGVRAKSRLALDPEVRRELASAMASDTVDAVHACPTVSQVTVLSSPSVAAGLGTPAHVLVEPEHPPSDPGSHPGLNELIDWAVAQLPVGPVAVVMGDLPALTPQALGEILEVARDCTRALVVDRHGTGTTVLTSRSRDELQPAFGRDSAQAHEAGGAHAIDASAGARCDVDDLEDLRHAAALGVGPRTLALLADRTVVLPVVRAAAD